MGFGVSFPRPTFVDVALSRYRNSNSTWQFADQGKHGQACLVQFCTIKVRKRLIPTSYPYLSSCMHLCLMSACTPSYQPSSLSFQRGERKKGGGGEDQREFPSSSFSPPTSSMQTPQNEKRPGETEAEREDEGGENSHSGGGRARCPPLLPLHSPVFCRDPLNGRKVPILFLLLPPLPTHRLSHMSCLYSGKTFAHHRL